MTQTLARRPATPATDVGRIATVTANGGATVTAVHVPNQHTIRVRCTRHQTLATITYTAATNGVEVNAYCRYAGISAQMHAAACTKRTGRGGTGR